MNLAQKARKATDDIKKITTECFIRTIKSSILEMSEDGYEFYEVPGAYELSFDEVSEWAKDNGFTITDGVVGQNKRQLIIYW